MTQPNDRQLQEHLKLVEASIRRCETFVNHIQERYGFPKGNVYETLHRLKVLEVDRTTEMRRREKVDSETVITDKESAETYINDVAARR